MGRHADRHSAGVARGKPADDQKRIRSLRVKEDLVNRLSSQFGLQPSQANQVVDSVVDYFKQNPDDLNEMMGKGGSWLDKLTGR
jgi:hypothetical protein